MAIEPYRHLLGIESTRTVARLCGVSAYSVDQYRKSLGVKAKPGPPSLPKPKRFPVNHPLRRYKPLLGIVHDQDVADLAGVSRTTVRNWREALGRAPADPLPKQPTTAKLKNYVGPWLGYESLFGSMSAAKISRAVGVPYPVVEQRGDDREFGKNRTLSFASSCNQFIVFSMDERKWRKLFDKQIGIL